MISCSWKDTFGIECMMCGAQRSFWALMDGDLFESIKLFPALIPLIFTFIFTITHLIFHYRLGAKIIVLSFLFTAALILFNFILKLIV